MMPLKFCWNSGTLTLVLYSVDSWRQDLKHSFLSKAPAFFGDSRDDHHIWTRLENNPGSKAWAAELSLWTNFPSHWKAFSGQSRAEQQHQTYLKLYKLIEKEDEKIAKMFNDLKRSNAFFKIAALRLNGVLTDAQMELFTEQTQAIVKDLCQFGR